VAEGIDRLLQRMEALLAPLREARDERRHFLSVYARTTRAIGDEIDRGGFVDGTWTEGWDLAFADRYLRALEQWNEDRSAPSPWQVAFDAAVTGPRVPPLRHVLLGINAHVNFDLAQALIAVISDEEFEDPAVVERRGADHSHVDDILASRVADEDRLLRAEERPGDRTLIDHALTPFNRAATKRFLTEAREKVWRNAAALSRSRREGPADLSARIDELGEISAARVEDLRRPGQVIHRLARRGFGVLLEGADEPPGARLGR
jgi:uncharacterized protein DUF5995